MNTYDAPDNESRLDDMLETEYSHSKVGKHARFCTQHNVMIRYELTL